MSAVTTPADLSPPTTLAAPLRLDWIDGLRGFAALFVVLSHCDTHLWRDAVIMQHTWLNQVIHKAAAYSHLSVNLFIVLSGFCLMMPILRNDGIVKGGWKEFARRRCRRILPPYYACLIITLLLHRFTPLGSPTGTFWQVTQPKNDAEFIYHAIIHFLLLHDLTGVMLFNYPLWSIATEFHLYMLFPLLLLFCKQAGSGIFCIIVTVLVIAGDRAGLQPVMPNCWHYIALFAMGMSAAAVVYGKNDTRLKTLITRLPIVVPPLLVVVILSVGLIPLGPKSIVPCDMITGIAASTLVATFALMPANPIRWLAARKSLVFLGTFSYSLYLIHAPVIHICYLIFVKPFIRNSDTGILVLMPIAASVSILLAYLFHLKFELPYLRSVQPGPADRARLFGWFGRKPSPASPDSPAKTKDDAAGEASGNAGATISPKCL